MILRFSHRELSLLLFALEGGELPASVVDPCAPDEHACPVADSFEELFGSPNLTPEKKLARQLVKHLQEGWIECGLMDLGQAGIRQAGPAVAEPGRDIAQDHRAAPGPISPEEQLSARRMANRLSEWTCEIDLAEEEHRLLSKALSRLPRSAWISMPRIMWRLRKKLERG